MPSYIHGHHASVLRSHRWRTAANSCAYLIPRLRPGLSVLDVGCGPGTITADLARAVAPGPVRAIDASAEVLDAARAASDGLANVSFAVGDVLRLDHPDDSFDVVHAHQVLQHVHDPVAALREMRRVCRPGGLVAARDADYAAFAWFPLLPELDEWSDLYRTAARHQGGEPDAGRRLASWAYAAGFDTVTATGSSWTYASPADREWWGGMWAERITASAIADTAIGLGLADRDGLDRLAAGWRRWAAAEDGWFLVPHGEILAEKNGTSRV